MQVEAPDQKKTPLTPMPVFWRRNRCLYLGLNMVTIISEFALLIASLVVLITKYKVETCDNQSQQERLRSSVVLMEIIHFYNIFRTVYKTYTNFQDLDDVKSTLCKCLIVDCYCSIASICYMYVQLVFFIYRNDCYDQMPTIDSWL